MYPKQKLTAVFNQEGHWVLASETTFYGANFERQKLNFFVFLSRFKNIVQTSTKC